MTDMNTRTDDFTEGPFAIPAVDIYENDDELLVIADIPGTRKEDVDVRMEKNELTLMARAASPARDLDAPEPPPILFKRTFLVRTRVDASALTASLDAGVLTLKLPKQKSVEPIQIPVTVG